MAGSESGIVVRSRIARWNRSLREAFLDHLAATCNVTASASSAGIPISSVYSKRRSDAEFRAQWDEALACGYQLLETRLVGHALVGGTPGAALRGDTLDPAISADMAMRLIALRNASTGGRRHVEGGSRRYASKAETDAALIRKLSAIEARLQARK